MKLRRVNPDSIKVPEVRVTARFDPEMWEMFQSSIKQVGAIAPIICYEVEGELILCDGLHRLVEAKKNGDKTINVAVLPGDMVDVLTKNIFLDHLRGKTPVSQMVEVIRALWREYDLDSEKIAEKTGLTRDYVEKLQKVSELTPLCLEALDQGRIGVGHASALTRIKDPVRQETVLQQLLLYHWTIAELEAYITDVLAILQEKVEEVPPEEPRAPPVVTCYFCRGGYDIAQISNPNVCVECAGALLASIAQARRELEGDQPLQNEP